METDKREICRHLWKECFHDSETYMDYYFFEKWKKNKVIWEEIEETAASMVHLNPYSLYYCGKTIKSYYIVGVATKEQYRKQGKMRKLLERSFNLMKEEGILFTFLMPADRKIYEPFGFRFIYTQERYKLHNIKENTKNNNMISKTTKELTKEEWKELISFCQKKLEDNFDIFTVRGKEYYEDLAKERKASGGEVRAFYEGKKLLGILSYGIEDEVLEVTESLIESEWTELVLEKLLFLETTKELFFLESYFLDEKVFSLFTSDIEKENVSIIMAKVLKQFETFESVLKGKKVYLNEIV